MGGAHPPDRLGADPDASWRSEASELRLTVHRYLSQLLVCRPGRMTMSFLTTSVAVFLATSAAATTVSLIPTHLAAAPTPGTATEDTAIRPFRVNIPEDSIVDLRRRIEMTRWPE